MVVFIFFFISCGHHKRSYQLAFSVDTKVQMATFSHLSDSRRDELPDIAEVICLGVKKKRRDPLVCAYNKSTVGWISLEEAALGREERPSLPITLQRFWIITEVVIVVVVFFSRFLPRKTCVRYSRGRGSIKKTKSDFYTHFLWASLTVRQD